MAPDPQGAAATATGRPLSSNQPPPSKYFTHVIGTGAPTARFNEGIVQIDFEDAKATVGQPANASKILEYFECFRPSGSASNASNTSNTSNALKTRVFGVFEVLEVLGVLPLLHWRLTVGLSRLLVHAHVVASREREWSRESVRRHKNPKESGVCVKQPHTAHHPPRVTRTTVSILLVERVLVSISRCPHAPDPPPPPARAMSPRPLHPSHFISLCTRTTTNSDDLCRSTRCPPGGPPIGFVRYAT